MSNRWTTKKPLPYPVCNATLIEACTNLFLCGGATRSLNSARDDIEAVSSISMIYRYDDRADSWGYVSELEVPRHNASCATIGKLRALCIFIFLYLIHIYLQYTFKHTRLINTFCMIINSCTY